MHISMYIRYATYPTEILYIYLYRSLPHLVACLVRPNELNQIACLVRPRFERLHAATVHAVHAAAGGVKKGALSEYDSTTAM